MKNDKLIVTALIGAISTIPAEILSILLIYFNFGKYSIYNLASLFVTLNRPAIVLGMIIDMLVGGTIAISFCFAFERLNSDYLVMKVTMASLLAWLVCELVFTFTIEGRFIEIRPISDYYNNILSAVAFGISTGLLLRRFLFNNSISKIQN